MPRVSGEAVWERCCGVLCQQTESKCSGDKLEVGGFPPPHFQPHNYFDSIYKTKQIHPIYHLRSSPLDSIWRSTNDPCLLSRDTISQRSRAGLMGLKSCHSRTEPSCRQHLPSCLFYHLEVLPVFDSEPPNLGLHDHLCLFFFNR